MEVLTMLGWAVAYLIPIAIVSHSLWQQSGVIQSRTSLHLTSKKPWLWTIRNKRYDLRAYVTEHPGGATMISLGQGRNCTELFECYHSLTTKAHPKLREFFVEDALPGDADYSDMFDWEHTPFWDTLRTRVRAHFSHRQQSHKMGWGKGVWTSAMVGASAYCVWGFLCGRWTAMFLLPVVYWLGPSTWMHDGAHASLSRHPRINTLCAYLGSAHMSITSWNQQHTVAHHTMTNLTGRDPDLYHFSFLARDGGVPGYRTLRSSAPISLYTSHVTCASYRHWAVRVLGHAELLLAILTRAVLTTVMPSLLWDYLSLTSFRQSFLGVSPYVPLSRCDIVRHLLGRLFLVIVCVVYPLVAFVLVPVVFTPMFDPSAATATATAMAGDPGIGWEERSVFESTERILLRIAKAGVFALWPYCVHGLIFFAFSQVSHIQAPCFAEESDIDSDATPASSTSTATSSPRGGSAETRPSASAVRREWAFHQVTHTLDYATDSLVWSYASVGLNNQIVHHLFPHVDWSHYRALAPVVGEVCAAFGVPYHARHVLPTFWHALAHQYQYLAQVNLHHPPAAPPPTPARLGSAPVHVTTATATMATRTQATTTPFDSSHIPTGGPSTGDPSRCLGCAHRPWPAAARRRVAPDALEFLGENDLLGTESDAPTKSRPG